MSFTKHPEERNKDHAVVQMIENQWKSKRCCFKNYHQAIKKGMETQRLNNKNAETLYHIAIKKIKALHATLSNKADRVVVEMNLKPHPNNVDGLHSICFSTCYFDLVCEVQNNYYIEYKLQNCPLHFEIMELFKRLGALKYMRGNT